MKRAGTFILLLFLAVTLTAAAAHKFYVAVFQIEHAPAKKQLQITSRVFIDDLNAALSKKYGKDLYLCTVKEVPEATEYLKKYFSEKMQIKINGVAKPLVFKTRETEDDVLLCYFTLSAPGEVTSMQIENTFLLEAYSEQQNIIHTKINGSKKSLLLTTDTPLGTIEF